MSFRLMLFSLAASFAIAGALLAQSSATSTTSSTPSAPSKKETKAKRPLAVTPEREAAVMTFIQRNHAELADLLTNLKSTQPEEYDQAVREIFRTTERLAQIHERDLLQYELELAVWTAQSRVQLLAAKLKMGATDELRDQLRAALLTQGEARLALLKHDRQKAADRVAKLEGEITQFESDRDKAINRQLQVLLRAAATGKTAKNLNKNPAKNTAKKPTTPPISVPTTSP